MCIVLDTPDIKRIDGANINNFELKKQEHKNDA